MTFELKHDQKDGIVYIYINGSNRANGRIYSQTTLFNTLAGKRDHTTWRLELDDRPTEYYTSKAKAIASI